MGKKTPLFLFFSKIQTAVSISKTAPIREEGILSLDRYL
ncbi:hypothetical protein LEP1GSC165_2455 [Leptospira santarosai str. CBC523]|nr:hypothetical protein LEP1GSC165_2455 [Leptospira santarosai str. CBC523]